VIALQLSHQAHYVKAAETSCSILSQLLYGLESRRLEFWEGRIAGFNDLIHFISRRDMELVKGHEQWADRVFFNPHGVDGDYFRPAPKNAFAAAWYSPGISGSS